MKDFAIHYPTIAAIALWITIILGCCVIVGAIWVAFVGTTEVPLEHED